MSKSKIDLTVEAKHVNLSKELFQAMGIPKVLVVEKKDPPTLGEMIMSKYSSVKVR